MLLTALYLLSVNQSCSGTVLDRGKPVADAAVWVEGTFTVKASKATVDQRHRTFSPHIQIVTVGSVIEFPNNDDVFHNVYAEFRAKRFDLGLYPKGQSKKVSFDKSGIVAVLCNIHPQMSAYVVIVNTPYFAKTDKNGHFSIPGIPASNVTVKVWHESGKTAEQNLGSQDQWGQLKLELRR